MATALESLYAQMRATLSGASAIWGTRTHPDLAPPGTERPYVVFNFVSGGELNWTRHQDAEITVQVKCVAETMATAFAGAAAISALLNDQGAQDCDGKVTGDDEWEITTITQDIVVHLPETFEKAKPIYHEGHQFVVTMQRKS